MTAIRVVIVDDHQVVREGLIAMLRGVEAIEIVGEADDAERALAVIETARPDVVLLDVRLRNSSGLDACRLIVARHPDISVVFLTVYEDEQYVFEALRAGGRGYMLKRATPEEIVGVLRAVLTGEVVVDPALGGRIMLRLAERAAERDWPGAHLGLTARESEILTQVVKGLDNRAIARTLFISEETVRTHVKAVRRKLGARDRTEAIAIALRRGILP